MRRSHPVRIELSYRSVPDRPTCSVRRDNDEGRRPIAKGLALDRTAGWGDGTNRTASYGGRIRR
jgi:hypothetical protein